MVAIEIILAGAAALVLISIFANKISEWLGVPALLIFLLVGMLAGSEGPGGIYFDDPFIAQSIGIVALAYILFSGGIDTRWSEVRPVLARGVVLATVGVLLTAVLVGAFATAVLGFSPLEGLLLGAVVSSTDAAAVFSILRTRRASMKGILRPLLELESGSNDPMAVFLTIGIISLILMPERSALTLVPLFIQQMAVGGLFGYGMGWLTVHLINRLKLEFEGLYPVLTLTMVLLTYGVTAALGGSGFIAVYICGLVLGNSTFVHKNSLIRFHEGIAWLMQITLFLTLGLLVFPSHLLPLIVPGILIALFLIFIARPVAVLLCLLPWRMDMREKVMVSWVGLRGAVPIVLATFPLLAGVPQADIIFNLVFFIVLISALLHGTSIPLVAQWLDVAAPLRSTRGLAMDIAPESDAPSELIELTVPPGAAVAGKQIVDLGLPPGALIILMEKKSERFVPNGSTVLEAGDNLLILAGGPLADEVRARFSAETPPREATAGEYSAMPKRTDSTANGPLDGEDDLT
ncbi:MAG: potassium/proton antiporter [Methanomicrobiales archaeon]|nr:potassium/proton antiporter [Methanomicrobiales archaeon]